MPTTQIKLRTPYGPVFRDVLDTPPRDCTVAEIPIIDLTPLSSQNEGERRALAAEVRAAAVNNGFFYIKNHGIEERVIEDAKKQLLKYVLVPFPAIVDFQGLGEGIREERRGEETRKICFLISR
jgi:hypothetical protein